MDNEYCTIDTCAAIRGINVDIDKAFFYYEKADKLSQEYGYEIGKAKDTRYGTVNTYHVDMLKEVFKR